MYHETNEDRDFIGKQKAIDKWNDEAAQKEIEDAFESYRKQQQMNKKQVSEQNRKAYDKRLKQGITPQDEKIIKLICIERTSQEIAEVLGKSKRTIENSRLMIQRILGCRNNVGIVKYAVREGIIEL